MTQRTPPPDSVHLDGQTAIEDASPDRPTRVLVEAPCDGGPFHGRTVAVRYPLGFLAVDRVNRVAWLYRMHPERNLFCVVPEDGHTGRPLDDARRLATADDPRFDVLAVPGDGA